MSNVITSANMTINFEAAVQLMDDCIREDLHDNMAPCADQAFFDAYCIAHEAKFGEQFVCDDPNGQW